MEGYAYAVKNRYRGLDRSVPPTGFNVCFGEIGMLIMGITKEQADDAVRRLNEAAPDARRAVLAQIRAELAG